MEYREGDYNEGDYIKMSDRAKNCPICGGELSEKNRDHEIDEYSLSAYISVIMKCKKCEVEIIHTYESDFDYSQSEIYKPPKKSPKISEKEMEQIKIKAAIQEAKKHMVSLLPEDSQ